MNGGEKQTVMGKIDRMNVLQNFADKDRPFPQRSPRAVLQAKPHDQAVAVPLPADELEQADEVKKRQARAGTEIDDFGVRGAVIRGGQFGWQSFSFINIARPLNGPDNSAIFPVHGILRS